MALLLGIDLGTSYLKAAVFDLEGNLRGLGRVSVEIDEPQPGRRELAVDAFLERLRVAVAAALQTAGTPRDVAAISYASQANTFLLLDAADTPLTPLIFWHDRRAHPLEPDLEAFGASAEHWRRTGMTQMAPGQAPVKVRWLARHAPEIWKRARSVMTVADYFTFFLTGEKVGDASTAALTGIYDLTHHTWWAEALPVFGLQGAQLSVPLLSGNNAGRLTARAAHFFNLSEGIPVAAGALDHHAAAIGSGLGTQVEASLSSGTVLAAIVLTDRITPMPGCLFGPHPGGSHFYSLAFDPNGAGRLEDYQRLRAPEISLPELMANLDEPQGRAVSPHVMNLRQQLREMAETEKQLLEKIAPGRRISRIAATGGGARTRTALRIKADVLRASVLSASPEPACLGAAILAGVGSGCFRNLDTALERMVHPCTITSNANGLVRRE